MEKGAPIKQATARAMLFTRLLVVPLVTSAVVGPALLIELLIELLSMLLMDGFMMKCASSLYLRKL